MTVVANSGSSRPPIPVRLEVVSSGLGKITSITHAGDGSGRLFVVDKRGYIRIVQDGRVAPEPFLDLEGPVRAKGNEQGLLGLAFHPNYRQNGLFFVHYTALDGAVTIARYRVSSSDPNQADPDSGLPLLVIPKKTAEDHNGGMLQFGSDGYLYIAVGDGGADAEPERNAQRTDVLLGKILRIDVDQEGQGNHYAIPPDNPFVDVPGARPEIWVYGLRNPWRFSIDRISNRIFIADVGLWASEEVNVQSMDAAGGRNFGWNLMQGHECHDVERAEECESGDLTPPIFVYHHDEGCAIIGGSVYRGTSVPRMAGLYLFADYCLGHLRTLRDKDGAWQASLPLASGLNISTLGEDQAGEQYVGDLRGTLFRVVPA